MQLFLPAGPMTDRLETRLAGVYSFASMEDRGRRVFLTAAGSFDREM
jgi:hypothetical protein